MTEEQWYADDTNRTLLDKTLQLQHMKEALDLLIAKGLPSRVRGTDITQTALQGSYNEGWFDFYRSLVKLSQHKTGSTFSAPGQPWDHVVKKMEQEEKDRESAAILRAEAANKLLTRKK